MQLIPLLLLTATLASAQCVSLTGSNPTYTQDFDTLANTAGSTTNTALPTGWFLTEGGGGARDNEQYAVDTGGSNTGDTYSYGAAGNSERAFGALRSGTLIPAIGACFTNNTGATITNLAISYRGEQWRLGTASRTDQINFLYSLNATSLTSGTYTSVAALNFVTPVTTTTGAKDGNADPNRTAIGPVNISSLSIAAGATFWIRWDDFDASGADDGLSVDDFSLTATTTGGGGTLPTLSINSTAVAEGNSGSQVVTLTVQLSAPAGPGGVTFDIATTNGSALAGEDYEARSLTGQAIAAGNSAYSFGVTVFGDAVPEANESFTVVVSNVTGATLQTGTGTITINNDDTAVTPISQIQGSGMTSPLTGQVSIQGITTAVVSNGFFVQTPDGQGDGNPATSEGIFVFTGSAGAKPAVGTLVQVTGTITEFSSDNLPPTLTELTGPSFSVIAPNQPLPAPVVLTAADLNPNQDCAARTRIDLMERYEGMRVAVGNLRVVAPTESDGVLFAVLPESTPRPLRTPGVECNSFPVGLSFPVDTPVFDSNPEMLAIDTNRQMGTTIALATLGQTINAFSGVIDFGNRTYTLAPDSTVTVSGPVYVSPAVRAATDTEFTTASMNLERFANDPAPIGKIVNVIRNKLRQPDIIALQEVLDAARLQAVATALNNVPSGETNPQYLAYLIPTPANDSISNGLLVKTYPVTGSTPRVNVTVAPFRIGENERVTGPGCDNDLNDRPPLVMEATVTNAVGTSLPITVIAVHQRSLIGVETEPCTREKRKQQTDFLANFIQTRISQNLIVLGDFNAFQFTDGYVDVLGGILGQPGLALLPNADLVNPDLTALTNLLPPDDRWSYLFRGDAQVLDHIVAAPSMATRVNTYTILHNNSPYPEDWGPLTDRAERIADHDHSIAYWNLGPSAPAIRVTATAPVQNPITRVATSTVTLTNTSQGTVSGPVHVAFEGLPPNVTLQNAAGTVNGAPYVTYPSGLAAGQAVNITVRFSNPTSVRITFTPRIFTGAI